MLRIRIRKLKESVFAMPVTAKDIARELQLSQPTVSRILSGVPGHRVAEATRIRVEETARRLGYQPNAVARSLRRGRTHIVGLYTNHDYDARNEFLGTIIGSLQRSCERQDLDLLLHSARFDRSAEEMYGKLRDGRIDGLILHANADDALVGLLGQSPLPVVTIADRLPNLPAVTCDDADGMHQLMTHLWRRGYRRFVFLAPDQPLTSVDRRRAAFEAEVARHKVAAGNHAVFAIGGEEVRAELGRLRAFGQGCAVVCWNDRTAYNLLRACREQGVRVPEDLAVAGFDGFADDKVPAWQLVTLRCPWGEVASAALDALIRRIDGLDEAPSETCLPVTLVMGNTA